MKTILNSALAIVLMSSCVSAIQPQSSDSKDLPISNQERTQVIEAVLKRLNESYVSREVASQMEQSIRARMRRRQYEQITSSSELAQTLTARLHEVYDDKHLGIRFSYEAIFADSGKNEPTPADR